MDGFWEGVQYYNQQKGKNVQVARLEREQPEGRHVRRSSFTDQNKGKQISQTFIQQGADVIFPVAGGAGLGAGAAAQASGGKVSVIWVDTDGCVSAAAVLPVLPHQRDEEPGRPVQTYVTRPPAGTFPTGSYIGTLANNGTGLAPVPPVRLQGARRPQEPSWTRCKADIISGAIKITSPSQPKS